MRQEIKSLEEMDKFALDLISKISPGKEAVVLALSGNLGAGKTAFVKSLAKNLGAARVIQSPTFVIMKKYEIKHPVFKFLIHIDAYRIEGHKELQILGWEEILKDPTNIVAIEWPENVKNLILNSATKIHFEFIDDKTRSVTGDL